MKINKTELSIGLNIMALAFLLVIATKLIIISQAINKIGWCY